MKKATLILILSSALFITNAQEVFYLGDSQSNENVKTKVFNDHVYQIVRDAGNSCSLYKFDISGNELWRVPLAQNLAPSDFLIDGNSIFIVGRTNDAISSSYNSIYLKVQDNVNSASVLLAKQFDIILRDAFTRIIKKPGQANQYLLQQYVIGSKGDDVRFVTVDSDFNVLSAVQYDSFDDQFWGGLRDDQTTLTLAGNMGGFTTGCFVEFASDLTFIRAYQYNDTRHVHDYIDRSTNRKIIVGASETFGGYIAEIAANGDMTWAKKLNNTQGVSQVFLDEVQTTIGGFKETYFLIGNYGSTAPYKQFVQKFEYSFSSGPASIAHKEENTKNSTSSFNVLWTRYFDDNSTDNKTGRFQVTDDKIIFSNQRVNATDGFGDSDVLIAITDKELNSCITDELSVTLSDFTTTKVPLSISTADASLPSTSDLTGPIDPSLTVKIICESDLCIVEKVDISTGVNKGNNTLYAYGDPDFYWELVDKPAIPSVPVGLPYKAAVIQGHPAWASQSGSRWISAFSTNALDVNNLPPERPYAFETCFCVADQSANVHIDFDVMADDLVSIDLVDEFGNVITNLIDMNSSNNSPAHFKSPRSVDEMIALDQGKHCIRANVRNSHRVAMGLNISGYVEGASFISYECCNSDNGQICGMKFNDKNCNGMFDPEEFADGIAGWEILLFDENDNLITITTTDEVGIYYFRDLEPGNYIVKEVNQADWSQQYPQSGVHTVTVNKLEVTDGIHFGNVFTGPITTSPISSTCAKVGSTVCLEWEGQECDCPLVLYAKACNDGVPIPIADIENTGKFNWVITNDFIGDFMFEIRDCDDNVVAFEGCVSIGDYAVSIQPTQEDCGVYSFAALISGVDVSEILSFSWSFDVFGSSNLSDPSWTFDDAGQYTIMLTIRTNDGCIIKDTITLDVDQGANDPNCMFCDPNLMQEIEGDIYIPNPCYGIILQSKSGKCFRLSVNDNGVLAAEPVTCPGSILD